MVAEDDSAAWVRIHPDAVVVKFEDLVYENVTYYHVTTEDDPFGIFLSWDDVRNHPSALQKYWEWMDRCIKEEF